MNNFLLTLFVGFLLLGNSVTSVAAFQGSINNIITDKTMGLQVSFTLPPQFSTADGSLAVPMDIVLHTKGGVSLYKTQVGVNLVILPELNFAEGTYYLTAYMADYTDVVSITIKK